MVWLLRAVAVSNSKASRIEQRNHIQKYGNGNPSRLNEAQPLRFWFQHPLWDRERLIVGDPQRDPTRAAA
jgi:hypothetical protein